MWAPLRCMLSRDPCEVTTEICRFCPITQGRLHRPCRRFTTVCSGVECSVCALACAAVRGQAAAAVGRRIRAPAGHGGTLRGQRLHAAPHAQDGLLRHHRHAMLRTPPPQALPCVGTVACTCSLELLPRFEGYNFSKFGGGHALHPPFKACRPAKNPCPSDPYSKILKPDRQGVGSKRTRNDVGLCAHQGGAPADTAAAGMLYCRGCSATYRGFTG